MRQRRLVWSFNLTRQLGNWNFNCGKSTTNVASKKRVDNETRLTYLGRGRANWAAKAAKNETRRSGRVAGRRRRPGRRARKRDETLWSSRWPRRGRRAEQQKTRRDALVESRAGGGGRAAARENETRRSGRVVGRAEVVEQSSKKRDETLWSSRGPAAAAGPPRAKTRRDALVESLAATVYPDPRRGPVGETDDHAFAALDGIESHRSTAVVYYHRRALSPERAPKVAVRLYGVLLSIPIPLLHFSCHAALARWTLILLARA